MAKIVFLSLVFPPDSVSTAQIMGELALELKARGHEVSVLTTTPHYNRDIIKEAKQPLFNYWGKFLRQSSFAGIPVFHISMPKKSKYLGARFAPLFHFHIWSCLVGAIVLRSPDILFVPSPPITLGVCGWILSKFHRAKLIYNVQEIYPDSAIHLGALQNRGIIQLLYKLEAFVYKKASVVTVIAPKMAHRLLEKNVPSNKIKVIPNFVDIQDMKPLPKKNPFSCKFNIQDKFVVSYAGNMGPAQDLETFIDCAEHLKENRNIHFLLIGEGMLREQLQVKARRLKLDNITFVPYQSYSLVPEIYASSDFCLVPQLSEMSSSAIPSKVYRIMACGRPVLAATTDNSDLAELIIDARCGRVVKSGSAASLVEAIIEGLKSPIELDAMGKAGRNYVVGRYNRKSISLLYHKLIVSLLNLKKDDGR